MSTFDECLKNHKEYIEEQHTAGDMFSHIFINKNDKENYCNDCLYIITLKGDETETHAFLSILLEEDFTWL